MNIQSLIDEHGKLQDAKQEIKEKVNYKGWGLLFIVFLIGVSVGFLLSGGFGG